FEHTLANGLKVIVYAEHALPIAAVSVVAYGGGSADRGMPGLAGMTTELLTKGTASRRATEIVEEIEFLGGSIGSGAGWDSSSAGLSILSRHLPQAFDVLADVVRNPAFPADEIERVREQRLTDILQSKANPSSVGYDRFCAAVYGTHPYAQPLDGTEASVTALQDTEMRALHGRLFAPDNMFAIGVGDIDPDAFVRLCEAAYGDLAPLGKVGSDIASPTLTGSRVVQVVDRPTAVQSSILVGHVGIPRGHEDYIAVYLLNMLFGGYFGSRLNLNLREDKGFTYGAHSRFDARVQPGPFSAGAEVRNEVTDRAIEEILFEMERLRQEPVGEEELANVKNYVVGSFPLQIETPSQVAQRMINIEIYGLPKSYYNTFNSSILALTPEDIQRTAQRWLHPEQTAIVAAGRGNLLRNTLERFGAVELFDADGQHIPNVESQAQDT
ncbi:MAG: insulinase family protein, partial [Bacteroidetes bacterium]|nr:insulinase family protein [Bacteroidota bacterium]